MKGATSCTICAMPEREAIDLQLKMGESVRHVATRYRLARATLGDHKTRCLRDGKAASAIVAPIPPEVLRAIEQATQGKGEPQTSADLARELGMLKGMLTASMIAALADGQLRLPVVREIRATLELLSKITLVKEERDPPSLPPTQEETARDMSDEARQSRSRTLVVQHLGALPADELAALLADVQAQRAAWDAHCAESAEALRLANEQGRLAHGAGEESAPVGGRNSRRQEAPHEETAAEREARISAQIGRDFDGEGIFGSEGNAL